MKKLLTTLCLVLLVSCSEPEVLDGPFLMRDGITFDQKTNKPITGKTEIFHENGRLESRSNYKDGKLDGLHEEFYVELLEEFYKNGERKKIENYKDGKKDGLNETFY